jgi:Tol biopolymer transport system component
MLDELIMEALEKDPDLRFQTASGLHSRCKRLSRDSARMSGSNSNLGAARERNGKSEPAPAHANRGLLWMIAAIGLAGSLGVSVWYNATRSTPPETRLDIVTPPLNDASSFALSPDGRKIAYTAITDGTARLWVRWFDSGSSQVLAGTEGAIFPFWSPDSHSLGFGADGKLKRVDLGGSPPRTLAEASQFRGGAWNDKDVILFTPTAGSGLFRVSAPGGSATPLAQAVGAASQRLPRFLPDGKHFLFYGLGKAPGIYLGLLRDDGKSAVPRLLTVTDTAGEYLPSGWLLWVQKNTLVARHFDAAGATLSGDPVPLAQPVASGYAVAGAFSVSRTGLIAWRTDLHARRQFVWFTRSGANTGVLGDPDDFNILYPELSPDGRRVALNRGSGGASDIWLTDGARSARFTFGASDNRFAIWSKDGSRLAFASNRNGTYDLYVKRTDGSGSEDLLLATPEVKIPDSWSPDGRFLLYSSAQNAGDLMVLPLGGNRKPYPFLSTPFSEGVGAFSPDGKWIAYQSNESGRFEVYVRPFPGPGGESQISANGGESPRWKADGKEVFYVAPGNHMMGVAISEQAGSLVTGQPVFLFSATTQVMPLGRPSYDVAPDGRFLLDVDLTDTSRVPITLLQNWKPPK